MKKRYLESWLTHQRERYAVTFFRLLLVSLIVKQDMVAIWLNKSFVAAGSLDG